MKMTLVRHGLPDEGNAARPHDPPLGAAGRRQAEAVAALLADDGVTRIVASPLLRAHETALPLAGRTGLAVDTVDGWAEADRHVAHYRSTETLRALGDAEWERFLADPVSYLGGDPQAFHREVLGALDATAAGDDDGAHVAVFTHGLPINVVLSHALGLERIVHFRPGYGSVTRLIVRGGRLGVVSVNESAHHRCA
ncbi:MAG TPA: histidine phosphatase family protein [Rubrivivax sp.]|nr:histidine phosphatase family protein [Rubrivivax sp.]